MNSSEHDIEKANEWIKSLQSKPRDLIDEPRPYGSNLREIIVEFEQSGQLTPSTSRSGNVSFGHSEVDHILEKYNIFDFREMRHPGKFVLISEQPNAEKVASKLRNIKPTIRLAVPNGFAYLHDPDPTRDRTPGICCCPSSGQQCTTWYDQQSCEALFGWAMGCIWRGFPADGYSCEDCKGACCTFAGYGQYHYPDGTSCDLDVIFGHTCADNVYWGDCAPTFDDNDSIFAGFGTTCPDACEDPDTYAWSRATADSWLGPWWYHGLDDHSGNFPPLMPRVPHADLQFNLQNMGYPEAWDMPPAQFPVSENVVVAVLDTGVGGFESSAPNWHRDDCWYEKVNSGIIEKHETTSISATSGITTDVDRYGGNYHGSACISVIGARHYNDDWGIKGACPHCKMVSVRVFDWWCYPYSGSNAEHCSQHDGSRNACNSDALCQSFMDSKWSDIADAIQYMADNYGRDSGSGYDGCIMSMSFGYTWYTFGDFSYTDPHGLGAEIAYATEQGCILVASAGNFNKYLVPFINTGWHNSPSGYPDVIEVASTRYAPYYQSGLHNRKSHYSNYGEMTNIAATVNYYKANTFSSSGVDEWTTCNNTLDCSSPVANPDSVHGYKRPYWACVDMDADDFPGYEINPWLGADSFCESGGADCIYDYDNDIWTGCCCRQYENEYGIESGFGGQWNPAIDDPAADGAWIESGGSGILALTPTGYHDGTSAAAPEIAGILGYMKSIFPGYDNNEQIINTLYDTATNIDSTNTNNPYGTSTEYDWGCDYSVEQDPYPCCVGHGGGYPGMWPWMGSCSGPRSAIGPGMLGAGLANARDALWQIWIESMIPLDIQYCDSHSECPAGEICYGLNAPQMYPGGPPMVDARCIPYESGFCGGGSYYGGGSHYCWLGDGGCSSSSSCSGPVQYCATHSGDDGSPCGFAGHAGIPDGAKCCQTEYTYGAPNKIGWDVPWQTYICSELNRQGYMSFDDMMASSQVSENKLNYYTQTGYHYFAVPTVELMRSQEITDLVSPFAIEWGKRMSYELGVGNSDSAIGKAIADIGIPYAESLGRWLEDNNMKNMQLKESVIEELVYNYLPGVFEGTEAEIINKIQLAVPLFFEDIENYTMEGKTKSITLPEKLTRHIKRLASKVEKFVKEKL